MILLPLDLIGELVFAFAPYEIDDEMLCRGYTWEVKLLVGVSVSR